MRVGFALGNIGPIGTAENLMKIAQRAEALAYDSLWTPASGRDARSGPAGPDRGSSHHCLTSN